MTGFFFEHLYSEQVLFVVRAGHPLLGEREDVFQRLGEFPVLMPTRGSIIRPFVERFFITNGVAVDPDPDRDRLGLLRPCLRAPERRRLDHLGRRRRRRDRRRHAGRRCRSTPRTPGVRSASPCAPTRSPRRPSRSCCRRSGKRRGRRRSTWGTVYFLPLASVFRRQRLSGARK